MYRPPLLVPKPTSGQGGDETLLGTQRKQPASLLFALQVVRGRGRQGGPEVVRSRVAIRVSDRRRRVCLQPWIDAGQAGTSEAQARILSAATDP